MIDLRELTVKPHQPELVVGRAPTLRRLDRDIPVGLDAYPRIPLYEKGTYTVSVADKDNVQRDFNVVEKATLPNFDPTTDRIMVEEWPKVEAYIQSLGSLNSEEQKAVLDRASESNPIWWFMRRYPMSAWVIDLAVSQGRNFLDPLNDELFPCPETVIAGGSFLGFNDQESLKVLNMLQLRKAVAQRNELMTQQLVKIIEDKMGAVLEGKDTSILGGDLAAGKSIYFMMAVNQIFSEQPALRQMFGNGEGRFPFHHIAADRDPRTEIVSKRWAARMEIEDILLPEVKYLVTGQSVFKGRTKRPDYIVSSGLCDYMKTREGNEPSKKGRFYNSMRKALAVGGTYVNFNILSDPRIMAESNGLQPIFDWEPMYTVTIEQMIRDHMHEGGFSPDEIQQVEVLDSGIGMVVAKKLRE